MTLYKCLPAIKEEYSFFLLVKKSIYPFANKTYVMEEENERISIDFHLLFDNSFDAILLTSPDGSIYKANKAATEMFGCSVLEFNQKGRNGIIDTTDPRLEAALEYRNRTGKFIGELTGIKKDGTKFPVELSSAIYKDEKGNAFACIIIRDISKRVFMEKSLAEQEANARAIMESTNETFLLVEKSGELIDCNETYTRRLNTPKEELIGKNIFELAPFINLNSIREEIIKTVDAGNPYFFEYEVSGLWYGITVHPVRYKNELTNRVAVFSKEITIQKKAEHALRENEDNLRMLNSTKDKFFSILAHDIKNPMNAIMGFSELLLEKIKGLHREDLSQMAELIYQSSTGIVELLDNLSIWARTQTGRLTINPRHIEMNNLIVQSVELLSAQSLKKSISIELNLPPSLQVIADEDMIKTVMRNLISNAIKYTNNKGLITVSASKDEKEAIVMVEDNGIGIKKERLETLFQIENAQSTGGTQDEKGTGLGLIICKEFIQIHGGRIWAESEPGKGSRFIFTIP